MVGTQADFSKALYQLCELDFDAIDAYQAAVERLKNPSYKLQLTEFKADHIRHTQELIALLTSKNKEFPAGPDFTKGLLAKGKVVIANLAGDTGILKAMKTNEDDTNTAYERLNSHMDKWPEAVAVLQRGLADEQRHRAWIENVLAENKQ